MNEKLKQLHEALTKQGFAVPDDYNVFEKTLQNPEKSKSFHQKLVDSGFSVPTDYNQFSSVLGLGEKKKAEPSPLETTGVPSSPGSSNRSEFNVKVNPTPEQAKQFAAATAAPNPEKERFQAAMKLSDESKARGVVNEAAGEVNRDFMDHVNQFSANVNKGIISTASSLPKAVAVIAQKLDQLTGTNHDKPIEHYETYKLGKWIDKKALDIGVTATDPELDNSFMEGTVPQAFGSMLGFLATGGMGSEATGMKLLADSPKLLPSAGRAAKELGTLLTSRTAVTGGMVQGVSEFEQAKKSGLSDQDAFKVFAKNFAVGTTEVLPIAHALERINTFTKGGLMKRFANIAIAGGKGGLEEGMQEGIQQYLSNEIASGTYDPARQPWDDMIKSMGAGSFVGFVLPGVLASTQAMSAEQRHDTKKALYEALIKAKIEKTKFVEPKQQSNAIPQRSSEEVLQRSQERIGEAGSERGRVESSQQGQETTGTQNETPLNPPAPEGGTERQGENAQEEVKQEPEQSHEAKIDDFAERLRQGEKFKDGDKKFFETNKEEITKLARNKNVAELPFTITDEEQPSGEEFAQEVQQPVQSPQEQSTEPSSEKRTTSSETPTEQSEPVPDKQKIEKIQELESILAHDATSKEKTGQGTLNSREDVQKELDDLKQSLDVPVNKEGKQKLIVYGTLKDAHTRGEAFNGTKLPAKPIQLSHEHVTDIKGYPEIEQSKEGMVKADVLEVTPKELEEAKNWENKKYNLETMDLPSGEKAYVFRMKPEAIAKLEKKSLPKDTKEGDQVDFEWLGAPKQGTIVGTTESGNIKIKTSNGRVYNVKKSDIGAQALASKGGLSLSDFERTMEPFGEGKDLKIYKEVLDLIHKYNPEGTVGQGMTGRKNKGLFYEYTRNIRLKGLNDLSVGMHELTHALDQGHGVIKKFISDTRPGDPIRRSLNRVYTEYYPGATKNENARTKAIEGYATLVQKYLESPSEIKKKYPELVEAFLKKDSPYAFPALGEFLSDVQNVIHRYQAATPLDKIGARVVDNRIDHVKRTDLNRFDRITQELFDRLAPIEKLDEEAGRNMTSDALHLWMRLSNNAMQLAEKNTTSKHHEFWQMDDKGHWSKKLDYNFNSLITDLDKRGAQVDFAHYLVARRVHEQYQALHELQVEAASGKGDILQIQEDMDKLQTIIHNDAIGEVEAKEAYEEGHKLFKEDEKRFDALMDENLEFLNNPMVQLLDKEGYDKLKSVKGYAPFKRSFYDELTGDVEPITMTSGKTRVGSLMGRHGSSKPIINPLVSAMNMHAEVLRKGMKQMVYNKVLDLAKDHPTLFQEMPLETGPKGNVYPQEKNPDVLMARRDYKRVPLLVSREIKGVIDENYQFHNMHMLEKVGIQMSQLFRTGTTGIYWQFFINNAFLDQMAATVNTRNGMMPFWSSFIEAFPAMANLASERVFGKAIWFPNSPEAAYLKEYLFLAGSTQTFLNADITNRHNMEDVVLGGNKSFLNKVSDYFTFLLQMLSVPGNVTEIATRFTEYSLARKSGKSQIVALEEAGRVSAPFHHQGRLGGNLGRSAVRTVPYFNSSLQVLRQMKRSLGTDVGKKRYAFVTLSMMAASAGTMLHLLDKDDDDEQKQILKTLGPDEMSKYLYFPNPYSDKRLLKVRIPEQMGWLSAMMNMMLIEGAGQTDYKWSEWGEAGASFLPTQMNPFNPTQMMFSYIPPAIKTPIETVAGFKTYPTVRPIETEHDKGLPPELRFNKYNSPVAIYLGETFGMSPKKIDHLLEGTLGRSVKYLTGKPGTYDVGNVFSKELYFEASRQIQMYYEVKERNNQQIKALEAGLKTYTKEDEDLMYKRQDLLADIEATLSEYKDIDQDVNMMEATRVRNEIFVMLRRLENLEK